MYESCGMDVIAKGAAVLVLYWINYGTLRRCSHVIRMKENDFVKYT